MLVKANLENLWATKGHIQGQCMSHQSSSFMYINIPKNASSWTKPNLIDYGWEFYNYRTDKLDKHSLIVLRDPVDRWVSGIAEFLTLYHSSYTLDSQETIDLIFDRITFDDHTERQVYFLDGIDTNNATFFWCDHNYRENFSKFISDEYGPNQYHRYDYQHVSDNSPDRKRFKHIFNLALEKNSKYLNQLKDHFESDYQLIEKIRFYGTGRPNK